MSRFKKIKSQLQFPANNSLWEFLNEYEYRSVTRQRLRYDLLEHAERKSIWLPHLPPATRGTFPWFDCHPQVAEFFTHFGQLRESEPGHSGYFLDGTRRFKLQSILRQIYNTKDFGEHAQYADCPVIFEASNGDVMILNAVGEFSWFSVSELELFPFARSLDGLLQQFIQLRRSNLRPFDSFGHRIEA